MQLIVAYSCRSELTQQSEGKILTNALLYKQRDTANVLQSPPNCPLEVDIGYLHLKFNKTGMYTSRKREPEPDDTSTWTFFNRIDEGIKALKTVESTDEFCTTQANSLTLLAGTDYASARQFATVSEINGDQVIQNPEKVSMMVASSIEALEILQEKCSLDESMILRSQQLIFQRHGLFPIDRTTPDKLPCIKERCIEEHEIEEITVLIKSNLMIILLFTIYKFIQTIKEIRRPTQPPTIDIEKTYPKPKRNMILQMTFVSIMLVIGLTSITLPVSMYETVLCLDT